MHLDSATSVENCTWTPLAASPERMSWHCRLIRDDKIAKTKCALVEKYCLLRASMNGTLSHTNNTM